MLQTGTNSLAVLMPAHHTEQKIIKTYKMFKMTNKLFQ